MIIIASSYVNLSLSQGSDFWKIHLWWKKCCVNMALNVSCYQNVFVVILSSYYRHHDLKDHCHFQWWFILLADIFRLCNYWLRNVDLIFSFVQICCCSYSWSLLLCYSQFLLSFFVFVFSFTPCPPVLP
jgi:hypothetical protein